MKATLAKNHLRVFLKISASDAKGEFTSLLAKMVFNSWENQLEIQVSAEYAVI